jgi:hypothetical protein
MYWLKRIGDIHIAVEKGSTTLCGRPMLGNNYYTPELFMKIPICPDCAKEHDKRKGRKNG